MQFHHQGYVSADPRVRTAAGTGIDRPADVPDEVDVLIVGAGPAGMITAAQLSQFPDVHTRIIDRRPSRLEVGQADGIQPRSMETFEAFGFADALEAEGCRIVETTFWRPDPANVAQIKRASRVPEDPQGVSEYFHITVNQARVLDYFARFMANAPARMQPDFGIECTGVRVEPSGSHPVTATLVYTAGPRKGERREVQAQYVVGAGGAHSPVRKSIGCVMSGTSSNHAWGVLDILAQTDFPDIRRKCAIQSHADGSMLIIPREGGYMVRLYVDLGSVPPDGSAAVRNTPVETTLAKARKIFHPYTLDVRDVARYSVYEVGHRLCDRFDDVPLDAVGQRMPRVFIAGDAAHTHSAQAGQGMNVSLQDGFNLGWKLGHVLEGRGPVALLATYSAERRAIGHDIIEFDKTWSSTMARSPEDFENPAEFDEAYLRITEFAQGFMTCYGPSMIVGESTHQKLASGFPIGRRFRSAPATRVADAGVREIGHEAVADGRWRLYVFADSSPVVDPTSGVHTFSTWLEELTRSLMGTRAAGGVRLAVRKWFDVKLIFQQPYTDVELTDVPAIYLPRVGPLGLTDYENIYAATPGRDIFEARGVDRAGAVVLVRPDQYVANIVPLASPDELEASIHGFLVA